MCAKKTSKDNASYVNGRQPTQALGQEVNTRITCPPILNPEDLKILLKTRASLAQAAAK